MKNMRIMKKISGFYHKNKDEKKMKTRCKRCLKLKKKNQILDSDVENYLFKIVKTSGTTIKLKRVHLSEIHNSGNFTSSDEYSTDSVPSDLYSNRIKDNYIDPTDPLGLKQDMTFLEPKQYTDWDYKEKNHIFNVDLSDIISDGMEELMKDLSPEQLSELEKEASSNNISDDTFPYLNEYPNWNNLYNFSYYRFDQENY